MNKKVYMLFAIAFASLLVALLIISSLISLCQDNDIIVEAIDCEVAGTLLDRDTTTALYEGIQIADASRFENINLGFINFDVSSSGNILVAYTNNRIAVYDENYSFLSGFLVTNGSGYYVQWHDDNIQIVFTRGSSCVEVSPQGDMKCGIKVDSNNGKLYANLSKKNNISTKSGVTFRAEKGANPFSVMLGNHYLKLIRISPDGSETILYDATSASIFRTLLVLIGAVCLFAIVLVGVYYGNKTKN